MNNEHLYQSYSGSEQTPPHMQWHAPYGDDTTQNTQWNGNNYRSSYQKPNGFSGNGSEPPKQKSPKKPIKPWVKIAGGIAILGSLFAYGFGRNIQNSKEDVISNLKDENDSQKEKPEN